jgi:hypothetical protein
MNPITVRRIDAGKSGAMLWIDDALNDLQIFCAVHDYTEIWKKDQRDT